ncbi:putative two-component histidine kinase [Gordonia polyisoprenivorans NBRC 16320 = JCM 10675]|uniref:histidine kinase n=1 Tax=Gordonia polyisoprenivorans TaxID=84595 RepID=A0A846WGQ8_9ACTN|nr:HAMP domain-containing sensor histidine kinase [Gordonia polyisoprenivorans]MBE7192129.1 HAMP domain-containing histidine kinase [Gordonia polyisoprenivorans]NKY00199.1 HAMP domain-containing histidine kinase [Gordonia polyisoprenivorans]UZF57312.1 HAMP domain-containing histidine kinase [Gordonia polyisoprenivorans]WCB38402.1 HAMP domain-containing sensor histidine kinase [Gordonia polyisoprenivorans]GAB25822.1 putative two-component histidine kinase [Gordonia polyisoprenivorans NBRC 16320
MTTIRTRLTGSSLRSRVTALAVVVLAVSLVALIAIGSALFAVAGHRAAGALLSDRATLAQQYARTSRTPEIFLQRIEGRSVRARLELADGEVFGRPTRDAVARRTITLKAPNSSWADGATLTLAVDGDLLGGVQSRLLIGMAITGSGALVLTALLLWFGMRYALAPLDTMTDVARSIARGRRGERLAPTRTDTELGRTAAAFDDMLDSLEGAEANQRAAQQSVRQFVADAAHELRTPVTGVQAIAETLLQMDADASAEDREQLLLLLIQETHRAGRLVGDMVDMARIDAGLALHPEAVDLVALAEDQCRRVAILHPELTVVATGDAPPTLADPGRISQILANLIDNACQATPAGGRVEVAVAHAPTESGGWVTVTVSDTGPGVPDADRERIFDRMVRLDDSRDRRSGGAGLGLAVARGLARAHGGEVRLLPRTPDGATQGAVFRLELPFRPTGRDRSAGSAAPHPR